MTFGEKIKKLREEKQKSQNNLAKIVGRTQQSVDAWERNLAKPQADIIEKLADYFNVSADYFWNREKERAEGAKISLEEIIRAVDDLGYSGKPLNQKSIIFIKGVIEELYKADFGKQMQDDEMKN